MPRRKGRRALLGARSSTSQIASKAVWCAPETTISNASCRSAEADSPPTGRARPSAPSRPARARREGEGGSSRADRPRKSRRNASVCRASRQSSTAPAAKASAADRPGQRVPPRLDRGQRAEREASGGEEAHDPAVGMAAEMVATLQPARASGRRPRSRRARPAGRLKPGRSRTTRSNRPRAALAPHVAAPFVTEPWTSTRRDTAASYKVGAFPPMQADFRCHKLCYARLADGAEADPEPQPGRRGLGPDRNDRRRDRALDPRSAGSFGSTAWGFLVGAILGIPAGDLHDVSSATGTPCDGGRLLHARPMPDQSCRSSPARP